jgi:hypothetical protein
MGLPLPDIVITAISDGKCRIILLRFKAVKFKNWLIQLIIYSYLKNNKG